MHPNDTRYAKNGPPKYDFTKTGEVFDSLIEDLKKPRPIEMPTGFIKLDNVIGGLHRGHMIVLAARPGGGKTAIAVQVGWNLAKKGFKVFYFSLEMSKKELITRILCAELEIEHDLIYKHQDMSAHMSRIMQTQELFNKTPFVVFDDVGYRFNDIDHVVRDFSKNKPDVVIIDHVQLVDKTGFHNATEALEQYARKCKEYSRTSNTAWLVLSQINRDAEKRTGSPRLENLKGSGALEEMADAVIIGSWDGYDGNEYKLDVAKHRHGRRALMKMKFEPKYFRFKNHDGVVAEMPVRPDAGVPASVRHFGLRDVEEQVF